MSDPGRSAADLNTEFDLHPGALVLDKYELVEPRGSGAMGTVWSARHTTLGHHVAIRLLSSRARASSDARQRFEREAKIAARLGEESPHIARVIDYGIFGDETPCLVMELLHGEELSARLKREQRLSIEVTAGLVSQLCRALAVAHHAGVVHRDIKPSNVFLCPIAGSDRVNVKLMDFGIAKAMRESSDEETTRVGVVVGTPAYMSPEQVLAQQEIDARTDLFSVGAMIYRMVVGALPFGIGSASEIGMRILSADPPAPSSLLPELPREFDAFVAKAMAKKPKDRFQTTRELSDALLAVAHIRQNALDLSLPPPPVMQPPTMPPGTPLTLLTPPPRPSPLIATPAPQPQRPPALVTPPPSSGPPIGLISDIPLAPKAMAPIDRPRFRTGSGLGPRTGGALGRGAETSSGSGMRIVWLAVALAVIIGAAVVAHSIVTTPRASSRRPSFDTQPMTTVSSAEPAAPSTITPPAASSGTAKKKTTPPH